MSRRSCVCFLRFSWIPDRIMMMRYPVSAALLHSDVYTVVLPDCTSPRISPFMAKCPSDGSPHRSRISSDTLPMFDVTLGFQCLVFSRYSLYLFQKKKSKSALLAGSQDWWPLLRSLMYSPTPSCMVRACRRRDRIPLNSSSLTDAMALLLSLMNTAFSLNSSAVGGTSL